MTDHTTNYILRDYQRAASDAAVEFFKDDGRKYNALLVLPTGAGKSVIVADIAYRLSADVLVFCPTKEIIQQNYRKMQSYGVPCSMYSASVGRKDIARVTFASIGSVRNSPELFTHFKYVIIDEAHYVNPKHGMYKSFLKKLSCKSVGLTATPYRLETDVVMDWKTRTFKSAKSYLKMLTDFKKPVFSEIIFDIGIKALLDRGYLSRLNYYDLTPDEWNERNLFKNSAGSDYTDKSVRALYDRAGLQNRLTRIVTRLLHPKDGSTRNGILVFTRFVKEAQALAMGIEDCAYISGDMTKAARERILSDFEQGRTKVLANAGVLVVGYDRPDLDTVVLAAPTLSLARYYQEIGRAIRPHPSKKAAWVVDLCGNIRRFGEVSDLRLSDTGKGRWEVFSGCRQLTNVYL